MDTTVKESVELMVELICALSVMAMLSHSNVHGCHQQTAGEAVLMENAVRISVPVWVTILIITVVFSAFGGWSLSARTYMEQESEQMENTQLHINQMLLEHSFHRYLHRISAYRRAAAIRSGNM
ncbi:MAG: hypothetical protein ACLTDX_19520 [[Clostridium] innocuum]